MLKEYIISEADLREKVLSKLAELGFTLKEKGELYFSTTDKAQLRALHLPSVRWELNRYRIWIEKHLPRYLSFFANGDEIRPERIRPCLVQVEEPWTRDLFRLGRFLWSLPYSNGYGRRLRFLIIDKTHEKLMGLLALQSPPLSFPARDRLFNYPSQRKTEKVNQTMDIYTLGAIPPYNTLLGGKLVALTAASNEIRQIYQHRYAHRLTHLEKRILPAHLVALTTTSAFGRSSLYNRLTYKGLRIAESIGYTEGYGIFHLTELYPLFRQFLEERGISTHGGFEKGPRFRWQTAVRALERIGLSAKLLKHSIKREVFLFPLINNLKAYMEGDTEEPEYRDLPLEELIIYWKERWLLPRAERCQEWKKWKNEELYQLLLPI